MNVRPSILCPVDYTKPSAGALRYAAALAEHFATRLIVLGVDDPYAMSATRTTLGPRHVERAMPELPLFVARTFADDAGVLSMCEQDLAVGRPATEILRVARERSCDLIVMSTHGAREPRPFAVGSVTEHVLRTTTVPVLVTPAADPGRTRVEDAPHLLQRIVVPVDLTPASFHQAHIAAGLAGALALPLLFLHVLEPAHRYSIVRGGGAPTENRQTDDAQHRLAALLATMPRMLDIGSLIVRGDPAEEVARVVRDAHAGLVVMGLHDNPCSGPRLGSVTFRSLCLTSALVLALPPRLKSAVYAEAPPDSYHARQAVRAASAFN